MGVVRDAFAPHDAAPRSLASAIAPLGSGRAAVASAIAEPHTRMLVDEYERTADGEYRLAAGSSDLLRWVALTFCTLSPWHCCRFAVNTAWWKLTLCRRCIGAGLQ